MSANFFPDEVLFLEEFIAVDSRGVESTYEWVSPDEALEVRWARFYSTQTGFCLVIAITMRRDGVFALQADNLVNLLCHQ